MPHFTISELKQNTSETPTTATVDTQLQQCVTKTTKSGKPYLQITLTDAIDQFSLKIWENLPQFNAIQDVGTDAFIRLEGDWIQNQYGIDANRWQFRLLNEGEIQTFLIGDPETSEIQTRDWNDIIQFTTGINDPRLNQLCRTFLDQHGDQLKRTAAARKNHHARRGGLIEHVAQMMRCAVSICSVYTDLNQDLLIAGVLFHDCGKLWENTYPERGFTQPHDIQGEMLGHIPLGINFVDRLWHEMITSCIETKEIWENLILHHVDNIDAKYEMMKQAYQSAPELAPGIQEKQFPLPANLIKPLAHITPQMAETHSSIGDKQPEPKVQPTQDTPIQTKVSIQKIEPSPEELKAPQPPQENLDLF